MKGTEAGQSERGTKMLYPRLGLKMEEGAMYRGMQQPVEAGKGKKTGSSQSLHKEMQPHCGF